MPASAITAIDALLGSWLFGGSVRPFLGLVLLMALRQLVQSLCPLPAPGMIWHYPGFPSLLVTYRVANDFFFSGHTAIAVFRRAGTVTIPLQMAHGHGDRNCPF